IGPVRACGRVEVAANSASNHGFAIVGCRPGEPERWGKVSTQRRASEPAASENRYQQRWLRQVVGERVRLVRPRQPRVHRQTSARVPRVTRVPTVLILDPVCGKAALRNKAWTNGGLEALQRQLQEIVD